MTEHTPECTCSCDPSFGNTGVDFCPLHKAAPDLLTALEALILAQEDWAKGSGKWDHEVWQQARTAIAKARAT